jgi:preprotein translocase subunit SecA
MEEGEPIEHKLVTRAIATAQKRVETHNFEIRKHLLEYDDVMNKQREIVYGMRGEILDGASQAETIQEWTEDLASGFLDAYAPANVHPEDWDLAGLTEALYRQFDLRVAPAEYKEVTSRDALAELVRTAVTERYRQREQEFGAALARAIERREMLIVIDHQWKDHLLSIDHLKEGIGLRGYGQRDPLTEYKREAFDLFQDMVERIKTMVIERLFKLQLVRDLALDVPGPAVWREARESRGETPSIGRQPAPAVPSRTPPGAKVGRNEPCPCGAKNPDGTPKKYKKCHGR